MGVVWCWGARGRRRQCEVLWRAQIEVLSRPHDHERLSGDGECETYGRLAGKWIRIRASWCFGRRSWSRRDGFCRSRSGERILDKSVVMNEQCLGQSVTSVARDWIVPEQSNLPAYAHAPPLSNYCLLLSMTPIPSNVRPHHPAPQRKGHHLHVNPDDCAPYKAQPL